MELYMPSREEWESMQKKLVLISEQMNTIVGELNNGQANSEHFPEYMTLNIAAEYLRCGIGRIKSMVYKQKLLPTHHIDLTSTVYVSKTEMDDLKYRVMAMQKMEQRKSKS
jgi:hypothetical protein